MKKIWCKCAFLFASFMLAFTVMAVCGNLCREMVPAAAKKGLKKEGNGYSYYLNGEQVKNQWVQVKAAGKTYQYYFGKDGRAYAADNMRKSMGYTKNILVKKIGRYSYGFDYKGRMVKNGYYSDGGELPHTYYFDAKGRLDKTKTKEIRNASTYGKNAAKLRKILGEPASDEKMDGCPQEPGFDYKLTYKNIYVAVHRYSDGKETVYDIFPN